MTTRKPTTRTTRKPTTRKTTKVAEPIVEPVPEVVYVQSPSSNGFLKGILVCVVLFLAWQAYGPSRQDQSPDSDVKPAVTGLAEQINKAMRHNPDAAKHARVLSIACRGVAGRLKDDFATDSPKYDQRGEIVELMGLVGYFGTAAKGFDYSGLPTVIEGVLQKYIGEEAGAVDNKTEEQAVKMFEDLSTAFAEAF